MQRQIIAALLCDGESKDTKRKDGAGNGIRTRDFNLGKVALYH